MKITFNINYRTNWGESLYLVGDIDELGNNDKAKAIRMAPGSNNNWAITAEISPARADFSYRYLVVHENGFVRNEWGVPHHCDIDPIAETVELFDSWQEIPWNKPLYASAFTECVCRHSDNPIKPAKPGTIRLKVEAPFVKPDEVLAISGSNEALGCWETSRLLPMTHAKGAEWHIDLKLSDVTIPFEYKFLTVDSNDYKPRLWEKGDNRRFGIVPASSNDIIIVGGMRFRLDYTPWHGAGVAIPVFSIRSNDDFGVGDFYDLKKMIDWAVDTHQQFLQILPINDTTMTHTWTDSYPYNANSTFALHPMYLRLEAMGKLSDKKLAQKFKRLAKQLNELPTVDYEQVNNAKTEYTKALFAEYGHADLASESFKAFFERNESWLRPYAAFCVLRDLNGTPDPTKWGKYATYRDKEIAQFIADHKEEIDYIYYIQYHLDKQLTEVRNYARSKGVAIKGDIPIGISRTSVDAWLYPDLFNLDCSAGAPPDDFSILGQNWGFPTYNWDVMARDGFAWWKARFRKMSEYFDAYRIDHVLGFFRIWQIPLDAVRGLLGVFNPALPFSQEELRRDYDFWLNVDLHTKPFIRDYMLHDFFGDYTEEVKIAFLQKTDGDQYRLKPEFDTQRKVAQFFANQPKNERNDKICNALMGLIDDVLFIEDPYEKGKFHPRISAQNTYIYRSMSDYERWCFDRLYNDFFYRRHNDFWRDKAMWKLPPLIDSTGMLVCAEDLGMIPACVPQVMSALEILSLEIQRMPKDPNSEFGDTWHYPYYSVCTTSTHDMGGIRQWWEEDREKTQRFFNNTLHQHGEAPYFAEPWVCDKIVDLHLASPSMLCILPLQDWLSIDGDIRREDPREEQINVPANSRHYWRYRMHLTIEQLQSATDFNNRIREMIDRNHR